MSVVAGRAEPECVETLQAVAELYASQAARVRRLVHLRLTAPDAVVEDACQVAWMRLVRNRDRVRRATAASWLVRVAAREALRLMDLGDRDRALEDLDGDDSRCAPDLIEAFADRHVRLGAIDRLPERQQRLVWLQGLGFSYSEMAGVTGDSRRTIERQLLRARQKLAEMAS
ncbi:MAG TPA: sigma-70 family RNA polymerase sigma factor [Solirubrobacteraceae bacterium]|nr:sigma-70 family RNA polymerase sigma factor [Solirubrobacteraceae bacterium]